MFPKVENDLVTVDTGISSRIYNKTQHIDTRVFFSHLLCPICTIL